MSRKNLLQWMMDTANGLLNPGPPPPVEIAPSPRVPSPSPNLSHPPAADDMLTERQQRAAERIQENESLTSDLTDTQARPLIEWASMQAVQAARDPARPEHEIDETVTAICRAVRHASRHATASHTAEQLVTMARAALDEQKASETKD